MIFSRNLKSKVMRSYADLLIAIICMAGSMVGGTLSAQSAPGPAKASTTPAASWSPNKLGAPVLRDPIFVYNNWSSYDELSDSIPLTEELAMKELDEMIRLREFGIRFDYCEPTAHRLVPQVILPTPHRRAKGRREPPVAASMGVG
jgi:hypothetical protein